MTSTDLKNILMAAGLPATLWILPDRTFEPCSADFVGRNFDAWLDARPAELVLWGDAGGKSMRLRPKWIEGAGDCDNLALGTMAWAQVGNALKAAKGTPRGGLAYGVIFYTAEPRVDNRFMAGGHAINWFVDHNNRLQFFEPGSGLIVDLTPTERGSSWFAIAS
jgi:hypothetical protein